MDRHERIEIVAAYLKRNGYAVTVAPRRGLDIVAIKGNEYAFVAVFDLKGRKTFPSNPFNSVCGGKRFVSLVVNAQRWCSGKGAVNPYKIKCHYDAAIVDEYGGLDYVVDAGKKGL